MYLNIVDRYIVKHATSMFITSFMFYFSLNVLTTRNPICFFRWSKIASTFALSILWLKGQFDHFYPEMKKTQLIWRTLNNQMMWHLLETYANYHWVSTDLLTFVLCRHLLFSIFLFICGVGGYISLFIQGNEVSYLSISAFILGKSMQMFWTSRSLN